MYKVKAAIRRLLNSFCFSPRHDGNCNGCLFKYVRKCPVNRLHNRLV